jgi:hypothetical protein
MNVDPAKAAGNGPLVGPSISTSSKPYTANGGCLDKPLGLSNDFSFPPGGVSSLHLPVVVVFALIYCLSMEIMILTSGNAYYNIFYFSDLWFQHLLYFCYPVDQY